MHKYGFKYKIEGVERLIDISAQNLTSAKVKLVNHLENTGVVEVLGRQVGT